jgi:hypothetical protein
MGYFTNPTSNRSAQQGAAKMHRRLSIQSVFLAAALTGTAGNAQATECRSAKGEGYPWAWREIDGKRCWYKGKPGMDKTLLRWAESAKVAATPQRQSPVVIGDHTEHERLLHSYWPPLPPADVFNDRFESSRAKGP